MKEKYVDVKLEVLELEEDMIITSGGGGIHGCFSVECASYDFNNGLPGCNYYCNDSIFNPDIGQSEHCQPVCQSFGC